MAGEPDDPEKLFELVADGESLDWDSLERAATDEALLKLIQQLRLISDVADVHRSQADESSGDVEPVSPALTGTAWPPSRSAHGDAVHRAGGGDAWGHLLLVRKIGEGSYGEVYHAHDTWLDHPVALKLVRPEAERRVHSSNILHEARRLARVRHDNVVTVHGADRHDGRVGFWMDLVDGETLSARVARGRLSPGEAAGIGLEVCRALAAVHRANIIHRDVKAQNVMRAHDGGRIILMDFGAGQQLDGPATGERAQGTPLYLAPELFTGEEASFRSDIYALGVLMFHLVTGRFPVEASSPQELAAAHARGERKRLRDERPDLPDSFIAIVERALEPSPARRYRSAGEMGAQLAGESWSTPVFTSVPVPATGDYVKRAAVAAAGLAVLTGVLGFIAARFFDVVIQVDRTFAAGLQDILSTGAGVVVGLGGIGLLGAGALWALFALQMLFAKSMPRAWKRVCGRVESWDPLLVAVGILLSAVGACAWLNMVAYGDLFGAMFALSADPGTTADLSILSTARRSIHTGHFAFSAWLALLLVLAAARWIPRLEQRAGDASAVRLMRWGVLAVAFITVAAAAAPRRILWERFPVVTFNNRVGFVIGTAGNEQLVYAPGEPGRPRIRVSSNPDLVHTGDNRFLFDPAPVR